jgi:hypothetical protein
MRAHHALPTVLLSLGLLGGTRPAAGQALGSEFRVNTYTTNDQGDASVASDGTGRFVVVWMSDYQDGSGAGIFGRRYNREGAALGGEFRVNSYTAGRQWRPAVATDANGNFVAVWSSYGQDGSRDGIFGQRYDRHGTKRGTEFRVNSLTAGSQSYPHVASNAAGDFVVVWETSQGDEIRAQRYDSNGTAQGAEFGVNSYSTGYQQRPSVASDAGGNFVVAWVSQASLYDPARIRGQRFDSQGNSSGEEFEVSSHTGSLISPAAASDPDGNFVVVWELYAYDFGGVGIFGRRFDSDGVPQADEFRVHTSTGGGQDEPSVALDANGNFVVAWHGYNYGGYQDVFARRYDSAGVPDGEEFVVNTYTTSSQRQPSVAMTGTDQFVVVWESNDQDGSFDGVFGQRFGFSRQPVDE